MTWVFLLSLVILGLLHAQEVHAQEDGLVGHWRFDEGKGSVIHDVSGNGHDGLLKDAEWIIDGHCFQIFTGCLGL